MSRLGPGGKIPYWAPCALRGEGLGPRESWPWGASPWGVVQLFSLGRSAVVPAAWGRPLRIGAASESGPPWASVGSARSKCEIQWWISVSAKPRKPSPYMVRDPPDSAISKRAPIHHNTEPPHVEFGRDARPGSGRALPFLWTAVAGREGSGLGPGTRPGNGLRAGLWGPSFRDGEGRRRLFCGRLELGGRRHGGRGAARLPSRGGMGGSDAMRVAPLGGRRKAVAICAPLGGWASLPPRGVCRSVFSFTRRGAEFYCCGARMMASPLGAMMRTSRPDSRISSVWITGSSTRLDPSQAPLPCQRS